LNQVTSIKYHGALDDDPPLAREVPSINEFEALDGVDPNDIMSEDEGYNANGDVGFTDFNFESATKVGTAPDDILMMATAPDNIITTDPELLTMLKSKEYSPSSAHSIASIFSATKNTIATMVGISILPARSHAKVDAVAQPENNRNF
jgi:hypothetical protein